MFIKPAAQMLEGCDVEEKIESLKNFTSKYFTHMTGPGTQARICCFTFGGFVVVSPFI